MTLTRICSAILFAALLGPAAYADTQWAIVIGISQYKNLPEEQWLRFADADARMFGDHLKSRFVGVPPENVNIILNERATTREIKNAIGSWLTDRVGPNDTVYIYFAGHGIVDKNNNAYFVTHDTDPKELYATAYEMLELKRVLTNMKYKHLVVLSDACKSGSIGKNEGTRDLDVVEIRINDAFKQITAQNAQIKKSDFILTAAGSNEKSYESADWGGGHGAFTYYLVDGLKGAADSDGDARITANEINDYVRLNVQKVTERKQNPLAHGGDFDGNLVLSTLDDSVPREAVTAAAPERATQPASAAPGSVLVTTNTAGTRIMIDNTLKGTVDPAGPKSFELAAGQHILMALRDGYEPYSAVIDVQGGRQATHTINLTTTVPSSAPEWRTRLSEAQSLLGTRDAEALKAFEALFNEVAAMRGTRALLADEESFTHEVFVSLVDLYSKRKQPARLTAVTEQYFQAFPFIPENVLSAAPAEFPAALAKLAASVTVDIEPRPSSLEIDSISYGTVTEPKVLFLRPGRTGSGCNETATRNSIPRRTSRPARDRSSKTG